MIQSLNDKEDGKSAYQTQENSADLGAGGSVDTMTKTVNDLRTQQQQILNAHAAAQLATQQGQGVTTAIDSRQRAEETRVSAIQSLAVGSLLAAAKGNLTYAQSLADKAVAEKFGPIEAQITAATENLKLIANDPETARQDKNRANAMLAIQNQTANAVAMAKSNYDAVLKAGIDAATKGAQFVPSAQYKTLAQALQGIQNAPDPMTATQIAASRGLTEAPLVKTGTWGTPYMLNGNAVQKNDLTGEIRTASSRVPAGPQPSAADEKQKALASLSNSILNVKSLPDGTPVLDANGNVTPKVLQKLLAAAPSEGLTEADVINTVRPYIYAPGGTIDSAYGLSVAQQKLVNTQ